MWPGFSLLAPARVGIAEDTTPGTAVSLSPATSSRSDLLIAINLMRGPQRGEETFSDFTEKAPNPHDDAALREASRGFGMFWDYECLGVQGPDVVGESHGTGQSRSTPVSASQAMCPWLAEAAFSASLRALKIWPQRVMSTMDDYAMILATTIMITLTITNAI